MHRLLARQLRKFGASTEGPPADWAGFLAAIDNAYEAADTDRILLERSMDLGSEELFEANRRLEAEQARLSGLLREAPAAIALFHGPEHLVTTANEQWKVLMGKRDPEGRTFQDLFPELDDTELPALLRRVYETGEPYLGHETLVPLDRSGSGFAEETHWNFIWQPVRGPDGRVTDVFLHAVEVTDQVLARRQVEERAEDLRRLAARLERSNRELDQFAYVTSHDLRAPLRGIANLAQWVEEDLGDDLPTASREHLALLHSRVQRMDSLINGILLYSRGGRQRDLAEEVDVGALVDEVIELVSSEGDVRIHVASDLPTIHAERVPLQQVFMNLVTNAIKYANVDPIVIVIESTDAGDLVEFSVTDNGVGIAPEFRERIFGIFQRLEARDAIEGAGIGLALVKKIVEMRGGRVWVESGAGGGSRFAFLWPRRVEEPAIGDESLEFEENEDIRAAGSML